MITSQKKVFVSLKDIKEAQQRITGNVNRTRLIRF